MGVKFAGSRSIDERRRRRLAGENDFSSPPPAAITSEAGFWNLQRIKDESEEIPNSPLASLLPPSRFRIWAYCVALPIAGLLLILFSQNGYLISDQRLQSVFGHQQGDLWRFIRGIIFLGAAGLCWLVSWFRSASDRDFEGCYKSWYFSGWIFLVFGFIAGCDAHLVFAQIVGDYTQMQEQFFRTLIWVVPMAALLLEPMRCFTREMWHCRRSFLMMTLCCLASLIYLGMKFPSSGQSDIFTADNSHLIAIATSILAPTLLFSAILSQVYHVMYVSSDPAPRRLSWTWLALTWVNQKIYGGLNIIASYCFCAVKTVSGSTQSRLKDRIGQAKKNRAERKAERKIAKQKIAEEKALRKEKERAESRKTTEAEPISTPETTTTKNSEKTARKKNRQSQSARSKPFSQIAADQQNRKESAGSEEFAPEAETNRKKSKPRVRLKAQTASSSHESQQPEVQQKSNRPVSQAEKQQTAGDIQTETAEPERIDPSNLKGLSKKERRRIRKLHREQQRANRRKAG